MHAHSTRNTYRCHQLGLHATSKADVQAFGKSLELVNGAFAQRGALHQHPIVILFHRRSCQAKEAQHLHGARDMAYWNVRT